MERARDVSVRKLAARVGRQIDVLVDCVDGDTAIARGRADAPEIDGVVRIEKAASLRPGDWAKVDVVASDEYDLTARLAPAA
jgi:ribosomal protein S12 methylthiotransferase